MVFKNYVFVFEVKNISEHSKMTVMEKRILEYEIEEAVDMAEKVAKSRNDANKVWTLKKVTG